MTWGWVRLGLFTGAFSIGILLSHHGLQSSRATAPVLNENAGASLVVACKDSSVVVGALEAGPNAIQLQCVQSKMVVVRDHSRLENIPAPKRTKAHFD